MAYYPRVFYYPEDEGGGDPTQAAAAAAAAKAVASEAAAKAAAISMGQTVKEVGALKKAYEDLLKAEKEATAARAAGNEQLARHIEEQNRLARETAGISEQQLDTLRNRIEAEEELQQNQELTLNYGKLIVDQIKKQVVALDEQRQKLGLTTGLFGQFDQQLTDSVATAARFGKGVAEVGATLGSLANGMVNFTHLSEASQNTLVEGSLALQQFGVDATSAAAANDFLMGSLGKSAEEAVGFQKNLIEFGAEIGVSGSKLVSEFGKNAEMLAKFGDKAGEVFKNLAKTAKATGVEMNELFSLADKFNTFDSAASAVGKLNAQMGTNLDTMTLLQEEDPAKQVEMLRDAFLATGKSLENMTKFEKMAAAEAMGMKLNVLEKFLGPKEEQTEANKNFEELTEKTMTFTKKISALGQQFLTLFTPLISGLVDVLDWVGKGVSWFGEFTETIAKNKEIVWTLGTVLGAIVLPAMIKVGWQQLLNTRNTIVSTAADIKKFVATQLLSYALVGNTIAKIASTVATAASTAAQWLATAATHAVTAATWLWNAAISSNIVVAGTAFAVAAGGAIAMWALEGATLAIEAATWLFNAALYANPIGLVILAVVGLIGALWLLWENMGAVGEFFTDIWDGITASIQAAVDLAGNALDTLGGWFGFGGDEEEETPGLAEGTSNFQGGRAIVGEKGPEMVNLPRGAEVIPNDKLATGESKVAATRAGGKEKPTVVKLILNERELGQAVLNVLDAKMSVFLGMD